MDGAVRCLAVFHQGHFFLDENNHALYPANVWLWTHLARLVGFDLSSVQRFYAVVGLMNCFAAAVCLVLFFRLSYLATCSNLFGLAVTFGLGFTRAFLLHATNPSEPMVAIFWSFLALYLAARSFKTASRWPAFFSGVLFALAMATYQTTVLCGPVAVLILWKAAQPSYPLNTLRPKMLSLSVFGSGALIGCLSIYGFIARFRLDSGFTAATKGSLIHSLFQDPGTLAYLSVTSGKLLNLPLGLLRNCYPVLGYFAGIRGFLRSSTFSIASVFLLLGIFAALAIYCALRIGSLWSTLDSRTRIAILCGLIGVAFTLVPLIIWDPHYDKLWIQPLACLIFLFGILFRAISANSTRLRIFTELAPTILLFGLLSNLGWVARARTAPIPELSGAQQLSAIVTHDDLVVVGWDGISVLYQYAFVRPDGHFISFPSDAIRRGPQAVITLRQSVNRTLAAGGRVFFLGLLDEPQQNWDSFLSSRCGVPFSDFNLYRAHSVPFASFETRYGPIAFKQLASWNSVQSIH